MPVFEVTDEDYDVQNSKWLTKSHNNVKYQKTCILIHYKLGFFQMADMDFKVQNQIIKNYGSN